MSSEVKAFTTAVAAAEAEDKGEAGETPFLVDGVECMAYKPKDGQLAVLMATTGRHSSMPEQIAGIINFFASVLDDFSHTHLVSRLLDRRDDFGIEEVTGIMEWMIEEWTGNPTQEPSGSQRSRSRGGQNSTPPTPALT